MSDTLEHIASQGVVPVIRAGTVEDAVATARACARAGMQVIELTQSVPDVDRALEQLRGEGLVLGVGTITDTRAIESAARASARFVVSYTNPPGFVQRARELQMTAIPGALTPTEFAGCADQGAPAIKLFPGRIVDPSYLGDLRAVLGDVRILVTGGIGQHIRAWLEAGALAVGLGSDLGTVAEVGADEVERRASRALELAAQARSSG